MESGPRPETAPDMQPRAGAVSRVRTRLQEAISGEYGSNPQASLQPVATPQVSSAPPLRLLDAAGVRPATAVRPFNFASAQIMDRQRQRAQAKAREREAHWQQQIRSFKARPPPAKIYGDVVSQRTREEHAQLRAERAAQRTKRETEMWARMSASFKAKAPPAHIYDLEQLRQFKQQRMEAKNAGPKLHPGCKDPPPAAMLPAWRFLDGTELRAQDDQRETALQGDVEVSAIPSKPSTPALPRLPVGPGSNASPDSRLQDATKSPMHGVYGSAEYWEERYARRAQEGGWQREGKQLFEEWYAPYSAFRELLLPLLNCTDRILHIGCGQSRLGADLYQDGFCNVLNMDISPVCVKQMDLAYRKLFPKMNCRVMDMTKLDCCDGSVEAILDKGSIDALMCTGSTLDMVTSSLAEFHRVLVPDGVYVVITGQSRTVNLLTEQRGKGLWKIDHLGRQDTGLGRRPVSVIVLRKK